MPVYPDSVVTIPSGDTFQTLIDRTNRHLYTGFREERDTLSQSYTAGGATLNFTNMTSGIQAGASLAIDSEIFYVYAINQKTATVGVADQGSTAADHASGAVVTVNPRFSQFDIANAINDELRDLSSPANGLFQVQNISVTFNAAIAGYDAASIPANFLDVQEVRWKPPGPSLTYPRVKRYEVFRQAPVADFPSGTALIVYDSPMPGRAMDVRYKAAFTPLTNLGDDVTTVAGLHAEAHDIPPLGAAIRLNVGREIKRNFTEDEGEPRRAAEVPPGAELKSTGGLQALRATRIRAEAARLKRWWPDYVRV